MRVKAGVLGCKVLGSVSQQNYLSGFSLYTTGIPIKHAIGREPEKTDTFGNDRMRCPDPSVT